MPPIRHAQLPRTAWPRHQYAELAALPSTPYWSRVLVKDVLAQWALLHLAETAELLVSELVTNAIKVWGVNVQPLSYPARGDVHCIGMRLLGNAHSVVVAVWDRDPRLPQPTNAGPDDEAGRGLLLVSSLAERWGYYRPPTIFDRQGRRLWPGSRGKVVWAEISDRPQPPGGTPPPVPPTI